MDSHPGQVARGAGDPNNAVYIMRIRLLNKRILELKSQLRDAISAQCANCAVEEQWERLANGFSDIDTEC